MPNVVLRPSQIYFLHDSIDCRFQDKTDMLDTFRQLLYKEINPTAIQPIAVFDKNDKLWVYAGNRRLYLFRKLEQLGVVEYITAWRVQKVDPDKWAKRNTTNNGGRSVSIRNAPQFEDKMQKIVREWKSKKRTEMKKLQDSKKIKTTSVPRTTNKSDSSSHQVDLNKEQRSLTGSAHISPKYTNYQATGSTDRIITPRQYIPYQPPAVTPSTRTYHHTVTMPDPVSSSDRNTRETNVKSRFSRKCCCISAVVLAVLIAVLILVLWLIL
ncbi:uncharacterized protein LOC102808008 [Saccoglossus kowalevskii]|uniref:Uncharacterized protein LOC102808008 n=1 Tax=Saccoglossus kowalevskii TaxID=10224 RepID=A0ABM0M6A0_SACKO|nr:PREDICTED: uncharacterized protein LOC102808008 [Saccoglossus kowalevskii]